jgi:undecaprenyl-diphosphatase
MRFSLSLAVVITAFLLFAGLGWLGGSGQALDEWVILHFQAWRGPNPGATGATILLTHAGGAPFLLALGAVGAGALLWLGERRRALMLVLTVLGGRIGVELVKLLVDRPRPAFDAHPVIVFSQSFPSGHAANSMVTYLALALFAAPERWRRAAVAGALVLAAAIGATRPMLGVHWPSDVLGGWIYGALVVAAAWRLSLRPQSGA